MFKEGVVVVGETPQLDKSVPQGGLGYGDFRWIAFAQYAMNVAQTLVAKECHGSHAENLVERAVEASARCAKFSANLGNMHRPDADRIHVTLHVLNQPNRRNRWPRRFSRQRGTAT